MSSTPTIQETLTRNANDAMVKGQIKYISTAEAYDLWSEVYDTDGNFLQALDTIEMRELLPRALQALPSTGPFKAVDLGCGTGRNTLQLLEYPQTHEIVGLELSPKMMEIAKSACETRLAESSETRTLTFETYDMIVSRCIPPASAKAAGLVVSTLVLEHVPSDVFFETCANLLRPGGVLLCTNMHAGMGKVSQAGFVDPKTGDKIRPVSYAHTVDEVVRSAKKAGLELVDEHGVKEVSVDENLAERLGQRGRKWIGVTVWFGGLWRKVPA